MGGPASLALRFPRRLILCALLAAAGWMLLIASKDLELRTSNLDLVDRDRPEVSRFLDFARAPSVRPTR